VWSDEICLDQLSEPAAGNVFQRLYQEDAQAYILNVKFQGAAVVPDVANL
jgi:hypothetical protein